MTVLIRSQDKNRLISLDNISYLEIEYGYPADDRCIIWATFDGDNQVDIGIYSSIGKAEEVLDSIESAACDWELLKASGHDLFAYYMPPDDAPWLNRRDDSAENNQTK